jgi:diaminopimelate decarboxylase
MRPVTARDPAVDAALADLGCAGADELSIGGVPASELARTFGTPLYAYAASAIAERFRSVQRAFGADIAVLWSIKANPGLAIGRLLRQLGAGAEVASAGELMLAEASGWLPVELRFAGPGKTVAELQFALGRGIGTFHVESADEVQALARLCREQDRRTGIAVRVNLPQSLAGARQRMGGGSSRFGVDRDQVPELLRAIAAEPRLLLRGLHVYSGTQTFDAAAWVEQAQAIRALAEKWERDLGLTFAEVDLGGGFGVAVYQGDPVFDLERAGRGLREMRASGRSRRWLVELGRYLIAPAGVYLASVVRTKMSGGEVHAVLDGGLHHCALATGMGAVLRRPPLLVKATSLREPARPCTVGGPLCTPLDQFGEQLPLPPLAQGDLVAVLHAGAYGLSYSPHGFLSHPLPAEVLVQDGVPRLVRKRGEYGDVLAGQEG